LLFFIFYIKQTTILYRVMWTWHCKIPTSLNIEDQSHRHHIMSDVNQVTPILSHFWSKFR